MKKALTALIVSAAVMMPATASAFHLGEYETLEQCEDAMADARRMGSEGLRGRDRGMFNKDFNARYECVYDEAEDMYVVEDYGAA